ncbi:MAG: hypothetical protein JWN00_5651 [Actinomycetia bacterium]|nr:hypothetical protein [Actinomycetes bacterium]
MPDHPDPAVRLAESWAKELRKTGALQAPYRASANVDFDQPYTKPVPPKVATVTPLHRRGQQEAD